MAEKALVIVESPTKAKTISKFLTKGFTIKASNGHVRDLPNNAAEVPAKYKKEKWAKLGVNIDADFEPLYVVPPNKKDHVEKLKQAVQEADVVYFATDEDREGESISWHLLELLKPKVPYHRLVFHEITKEAILEAVRTPRNIDVNLVRAQETRRIIDRLFGYEVSPVLWKKMARGLSAGRVQSVAIKLLVERERERIKFKTASYWDLAAEFQKAQDIAFPAELTHVRGQRIATSKDFDPDTGKLRDADKVLLLSKADAEKVHASVSASSPRVDLVEEKPFTQTPPAPFVTSTLQQEANRKLRYSAKRTMSVAQQLYENGFITYMRTDSTTLSEQALSAARSLIANDFGPEYLPDSPRTYQTKVKNAQEAHEAIRPAGESFTPMDTVRSQLGDEASKLYELIWKRTVASQMKDAKGTYISVHIDAGDARFRASGKTIAFAGFLRAYVEGSDDPEAELADQERILPKLAKGDTLITKKLEALEHHTQPPSRFTEGSLIKELERRGIGRPSTWATVVELVLSRQYAFKRGTALVPTFTAMAVVKLLDAHFSNLMDYDFTARLEDDLDSISRGESKNVQYLKSFYFGNGHPGLKTLVTEGEAKIDPREVCGLPLGTTADGVVVEVRIGKFGPFLTNGTERAGVPDEFAPDEMDIEKAQELLKNANREQEALGAHPETGEAIYLKVGRFGPYVQLGKQQEGSKERPKMASLLPGMSLDSVTAEIASRLLALPRVVGKHPELGEDILAQNGRYGPYIKCGADTRSVSGEISVLDITLEQALELLKQPKTRGRAASQPAALKEIGLHPESKQTMQLKSGRYGPYVTDGTINASVPKGTDAMTLTIEQAVELLRARAQKIAENGPAPKKSKRSRGATKKATSKASTKAAAKKGSKKKTEEVVAEA